MTCCLSPTRMAQLLQLTETFLSKIEQSGLQRSWALSNSLPLKLQEQGNMLTDCWDAIYSFLEAVEMNAISKSKCFSYLNWRQTKYDKMNSQIAPNFGFEFGIVKYSEGFYYNVGGIEKHLQNVFCWVCEKWKYWSFRRSWQLPSKILRKNGV